MKPTYAFIGRRVVEGGPRRYNQTVNTCYGTATLDGRSHVGERDWYWDVNGVSGQNKAKQTMFGNVNAANAAAGARADRRLHRLLRAVQYLRRRGSITQAMLDFVGFDPE